MNPRKAAQWIAAYQYCQANRSVPAVLAEVAAKKYKPALAAAMKPKKPKIRVPRGVKVKTAQAAKKDLRKELEALCKAIVFTRDCGSPEAREGHCISCGHWRVLQWGHFIRQQDCKWLQYDPRNTGGQCRQCNMNGGNVLKYAEAIDYRDGDGAAKALQAESDMKKAMGWRPNKTTLGEMLRKLQSHPLAPKAPVSAEREPSIPESHPVTSKLPNPPGGKE